MGACIGHDPRFELARLSHPSPTKSLQILGHVKLNMLQDRYMESPAKVGSVIPQASMMLNQKPSGQSFLPVLQSCSSLSFLLYFVCRGLRLFLSSGLHGQRGVFSASRYWVTYKHLKPSGFARSRLVSHLMIFSCTCWLPQENFWLIPESLVRGGGFPCCQKALNFADVRQTTLRA